MLQSDQSYYLVPYVSSQDYLAIEIIVHENVTDQTFENLRDTLQHNDLGNPDFFEITEVHPVHGIIRHELHELLAKFGKFKADE